MELPEKKLFKPVERIQKGQPMPTGMPPKKSAEEKLYYLLIVYKEDCNDPTWKQCIGRTDTIDEAVVYIRDNADLERSLVLVEGVVVEKSISLYWFMRRMQEVGAIQNFDIEEFMEADCQEAVKASLADIPEQVSVMNNDFDVDNTEDI